MSPSVVSPNPAAYSHFIVSPFLFLGSIVNWSPYCSQRTFQYTSYQEVFINSLSPWLTHLVSLEGIFMQIIYSLMKKVSQSKWETELRSLMRVNLNIHRLDPAVNRVHVHTMCCIYYSSMFGKPQICKPV